MRRLVFLALIFTLIVPVILTGPTSAQLAAQDAPAGLKTAAQVQAVLDSLPDGEMTTVIVTLADQADLSQIPGSSRAARLRGIIRALQAKADASQRALRALLEIRRSQGHVSQVTPFWVFNGLAVTATGDVIQEVAGRDEVYSITPDEIQVALASPAAAGLPESNLSVVNAPALWDMGVYGQGVVVANMDSGVDASHPDLSGRWRGGSNSWFDPHGEHPSTPTDLDGHGTWTMGVMVGGDAGGSSIGVAPQAQWVAVKIFNDAGAATASAIHQGFQWLLDPDGDPGTDDAPHVVNNSWTLADPGCDLEFQLDLTALRAAGILPVFAAGNGGPSAGTSYSPSNNPAALAVGGTDNGDNLYVNSSRGPSGCGEPATIYPELSAPGVGVHTTDLYSFYTDATGTSLAAPHVAGELALLLSAYPDLTDAHQESALLNSAVDLGPLGPDNDYGYGRLDILAAYQWLASALPPTATATPTPTPTPAPGDGNLALNQPVTVSSFQDDSHDGSAAVDGDLATFWKSRKASGKNKLPSEWISVDLGSSVSISQVVLEWDSNYATDYVIQVSQDGSAWTTVYSTASGDGGNDAISFSSTPACYVKMESTAWSSGSLRAWLKELEVYGGSGSPPPPSTPAPTPTPTATATPTPPGGGTTLHVGDLDGSSSPGGRNRWNATVTITVHDADENAVAGATVHGSWSDGASGSGSCVTDDTGRCNITKNNIKGNVSSVSFGVDSLEQASMSYQPSSNHDPDDDSSGTSILVLKP